METNSVLALFDFDKTLITTDSFRLFVRTCAASPGDHLRLIASTVLCRAGVVSNLRYKQYLLQRVWYCRPLEVQKTLLKRFCGVAGRRQNSTVVGRLLDHARKGHTLAVLSASPQFYLEPVVHAICPTVEVYGSQVSFDGNRVEMVNLYGQDKAERAEALIRDLNPQRVHVYTDHLSDLPLLRLADSATLVRPRRRLLREMRRLRVEFETIP